MKRNKRAFVAMAFSFLVAGQVCAQAPVASADDQAKDAKPSLIIAKDEPISVQLIGFAKTQGWSLLWDADEYTAPVNMQIAGGAEEALTYFLDGARNAGVNLTGVVHRNIKTIHITE